MFCGPIGIYLLPWAATILQEMGIVVEFLVWLFVVVAVILELFMLLVVYGKKLGAVNEFGVGNGGFSKLDDEHAEEIEKYQSTL